MFDLSGPWRLCPVSPLLEAPSFLHLRGVSVPWSSVQSRQLSYGARA